MGGYLKIREVFPEELIVEMQKYAQGAHVYIPRTKQTILKDKSYEIERNKNIYQDYLSGMKTRDILTKYFITMPHINAIIRKVKGGYYD